MKAKHIKVNIKKVRFPDLPRCEAKTKSGRFCNNLAIFRIFGLHICNQQDCKDYAMSQNLSEYETMKKEAEA